MISSSEAQKQLLEYTLTEFCILLRRNGAHKDYIEEKTMYLNYLCARGDIQKVKEFIKELESDRKELKTILNMKQYEFWYGTILHTVLYWNTNKTAIELYTLLVELGARNIKDYYEVFPWELDISNWIDLITGNLIGIRDLSEFKETYESIYNLYGKRTVVRRLDFDTDYSDMPPLEDVPKENELPILKRKITDQEDREKDIPPANYSDEVTKTEKKLVYSDEEEFYNDYFL